MKYAVPIAFILALVAVFFMGKGCSPEPDKMTPIIQKEVERRDSDLKQADKKDSVVTIYRDRWRDRDEPLIKEAELKKLPCDSILPIIERDADTIIVADSTEIVLLRKALCIDDTIISQQGKQIKVLGRKLRRQKALRWLFFGAGAAAAVLIR